MKKSILKIVSVLFLATIIWSCSNNNDGPTTPAPMPDSRNVKYEVTGTAVGTYDVNYATANGQAANTIPSSLPWSKEVVFQANIKVTRLDCAVLGALPGTTITARIYVGGEVKKQQTATVPADGTAIISALTYTLN